MGFTDEFPGRLQGLSKQDKGHKVWFKVSKNVRNKLPCLQVTEVSAAKGPRRQDDKSWEGKGPKNTCLTKISPSQ